LDARRLDDPLGRLVADLVYGPEGLEEAQWEADGLEPEYIEFSVVMVPGQPNDIDLDPPLAFGEVINAFLLVRAADADTAESWDEIEAYLELGEVECERAAHRQFPRKLLPEAEVEGFRDEETEEVSSDRDATSARRTIIFEQVVQPDWARRSGTSEAGASPRPPASVHATVPGSTRSAKAHARTGR
jgi:hypothetical protein